MMAVRERSLREKDECRRKISEINQEITRETGEKVMRAKEERFRVSQSVQRVRAKN
jgi:predicted translin family RNA/ssDNA-binding protein